MQGSLTVFLAWRQLFWACAGVLDTPCACSKQVSTVGHGAGAVDVVALQAGKFAQGGRESHQTELQGGGFSQGLGISGRSMCGASVLYSSALRIQLHVAGRQASLHSV